MKFLPLVTGEFTKIPRILLLFCTAIFALIPVLVSLIVYKQGYDTFAAQGLANSSGLLLYYHFVNNYCVVILSAFLWFFIYSKENSYNTWSLLLTKIPYTVSIIGAKSIVFIVYYVISVIIAYGSLLIVCLMQGISVEFRTIFSSLLISLLITISIGFLQFIFHTIIRNGLIASSISIVWIILLFLYNNFPYAVQLLFPLFLSTTAIELSNLKDMFTIIFFAIGSGLFIVVTVLLSAKKQLFQTD
ncbi:hypothetical protein SH601_15165 [Gracilibacillus sp. S3-1-1]|uniref:Uncharacterized protein n=1 Tax=Gracilibacillus pellucidus TaxID=3095368 RepID=A0ACC6M8J6_9BACI|nr:hypothetical protein [Gracilibacillus sp. S3-1-1]MDX8047308.1 hypothetical protein [Gracilibacillus sp. S3-1-1]